MARDTTVPEAWVRMPSDEEVLARLRSAGVSHPYDFGFFPAMGRLIAAHPRIGAAFGALFTQIMFAPEGRLERREREMVAAVAAAAQDCHY
jgi:hypothetical protein